MIADELPRAWNWRRLEEICSINAPIMYGILQPGPEVQGGIPYVRPTEINDEGIKLAEIKRTSPEIASRYKRSVLRHGDLLITIVGTLGRIAVVPKELDGANITQSSARIRLAPEVAVREYVRQVLRSELATRQYEASKLGTGVPRLNIHHVRDLRIPLPPVEEQQRIAEVLDRAEALRTKRRAALTQLDTLTQSIFLDLFGDPASNPKKWPRHALVDLIVDGPQNGLYKPSTDYGSGVPIVRIDAFYNGVVTKLAQLKRLRVTDGELLLYALRPGDILVNRVNSIEYLGKSALIPYSKSRLSSNRISCA